jgi:hypothetical protein
VSGLIPAPVGDPLWCLEPNSRGSLTTGYEGIKFLSFVNQAATRIESSGLAATLGRRRRAQRNQGDS